MKKASEGEDDSEPWMRLNAARKEIDSLAEEKLQIVMKIYNLSQRFVQELNESIAETDKLIDQQKSTSGRGGQSFADVQACLAVNTKSNYDMDDGIDNGFGIETNIGVKRKGQHRGADGKFESNLKDIDVLDMDEGFGSIYGSQKSNKQSKASKIASMGSTMGINRKVNDPFDGPKKRKGGRGAGGHVATVFYDS